MTRQYNKVKLLEDEVFRLKEEGKTNREICEILGFSDLKVLKNLINRYNRRSLNAVNDRSVPKRRGRPRKNPIITNEKELQLELNRLKMENELLRNFLLELGRG